MQLISTKDIADVIKYNDESVIIVEKLPLPNGTQYKVQYSVVNFKTKSIDVLTKNAYLLKKFGSNFNRISQIMPNFVQCDAGVLYDRRVLAVFPNGEAVYLTVTASLNGTVHLNITTSRLNTWHLRVSIFGVFALMKTVLLDIQAKI